LDEQVPADLERDRGQCEGQKPMPEKMKMMGVHRRFPNRE
jgi:hypothetical protein